MEGDFLASLSQRLKRRLGPKPTKDKEVPPLGWQGFDAARLADRLASLSEDVRRNNVLCIVRLGGASSDDLTDFWRRVSETYAGELANYLALIISGPVGTAFPPGILPLPMPQFEYWHFREWALQVVEHFQWDDQDLPERWGMRMYEESLEATEVWKTYQILDREIEILKSMRSDPIGLLRHLQERASYAVPTST